MVDITAAFLGQEESIPGCKLKPHLLALSHETRLFPCLRPLHSTDYGGVENMRAMETQNKQFFYVTSLPKWEGNEFAFLY